MTNTEHDKDTGGVLIRTGQFDYHRIDIQEWSLAVSVSGSTAKVAVKGIFDATINGAHAPWPLQFTMTWSHQGGA
jgi:hypothetical protein